MALENNSTNNFCTHTTVAVEQPSRNARRREIKRGPCPTCEYPDRTATTAVPLTISLYSLRHPLPGKDKACTERYAFLRDALGPNYGDKTPLPLTRVLEINGLSDTLWAIDNCIDGGDKILRLFVCDCAERVLHFFETSRPNDIRVRECITVARRFAAGTATIEELYAAGYAARAAWTAAGAAGYAAGAAWNAARAAGAAAGAAWYAARAAWAAAGAAWAAAGHAAGDAAGAAEEKWQLARLIEYLNESVSPMPAR